MSRRQRITQIEGQFAPRRIDMLRSPAMQALSLTARRVLDRLEIELADHGGKENGNLPCTYDDFERFGIHRHQIAAGLAELTALGFVEITRPGRAGNAEFRLPTLFRLTYRHTKYAQPTDEWKIIVSENDANTIVRASRERWRERGKKQKASGEFRHVSVPVSDTKSAHFHSTNTAITGISAETTTTLDISVRGGTDDLRRTNAHSSPQAQHIGPQSAPCSEQINSVGHPADTQEGPKPGVGNYSMTSNGLKQSPDFDTPGDAQNAPLAAGRYEDTIHRNSLLAAAVERASQRWAKEKMARRALPPPDTNTIADLLRNVSAAETAYRLNPDSVDAEDDLIAARRALNEANAASHRTVSWDELRLARGRARISRTTNYTDLKHGRE